MVETQAQSSVSSVLSVHAELFMLVFILSSLFLFYFSQFIYLLFSWIVLYL